VLGVLHELHAAGATVLVITHDHEIAASLPRRIAVRDGRIEEDVLATA
jgi:putative ABC transport system ATP-binding protein